VSRLTAAHVDRLKPLVFCLGLIPFLRWFVLGWQDNLTANPTEFLTRSSGLWTLVILVVTLSISPLRQVLDQPALIRLRRMCGLFTFFYASLHMLAWAWWEQGLHLGDMFNDVIERPFVTIGMFAFVILLLLALTSSQRAMRTMGRGWKRLHRGVYVVGILVIIHFWLHKAGKNDFYEVSLYGAVILALLAWRIWVWIRPETKKASVRH
jgi:methionine sulfoxide reductase heme-binding subunit